MESRERPNLQGLITLATRDIRSSSTVFAPESIYIVAPLALPGVIATSIFTFTLAWNDYIFTRIPIVSDELKTLPVGVQDLFSAAVVDGGLVMAAGMLITIPALAFFMVVQRHLVAGWCTGGLKG